MRVCRAGSTSWIRTRWPTPPGSSSGAMPEGDLARPVCTTGRVITLRSTDGRWFCGGGAAVLGALIESLLHGATPARAALLAGRVPEVDRVAVRAVVDSYQIAIAPSTVVGNVEIQRFGWALGDQPPSKALISEFGLSMHIELQRGDERGRCSWTSASRRRP